MINHWVLFCRSHLLNRFQLNPFLPSPATSFVGNIMSSHAACHTHIEFSHLGCCFFFYRLRWISVAAHGLSLGARSWGYSSLWCPGFSLRCVLLWNTDCRALGLQELWHADWIAVSPGPWSIGSIVVAQRPSCHEAWGNLPRPGFEPSSPVLAGGFFTTLSRQGSPLSCLFYERSVSPFFWSRTQIWTKAANKWIRADPPVPRI